MILPVKTQCRRHRRVMEVILLKQKQIKWFIGFHVAIELGT